MRVSCHDPGARETLRRLGVDDSCSSPDRILVPGDWPPERVEALGDAARVDRIRAESIEAILDEILRVGELVGEVAHAESLMVEVRERMHAAADHVNPYADAPSVAMIVGDEPVQIAGGFLAQLAERAGAIPAFNPTRVAPGCGSASGPQMAYRRTGGPVSISDADLRSSPVDLAVLAPRGASLADAIALGRTLARRGVLPVRSAAVDPAIVHAGGPFVADAFEWLVAWIHDLPARMPGSVAWASIGE